MNLGDLFDRDSFCVLPIVHSFVDPTGNASLCCINGNDKIGNVNSSSFASVYSKDNPVLRTIREDMVLHNKLPNSCQEKCSNNSVLAHDSYRVGSNNYYKDAFLEHFTTEEELINNEDIFYLDIRFSNLCNLRCVYCNHEESTRVAELNNIVPALRTIDKDASELMEFIKSNLNTINRVNFAGGEPTIMKEHFNLLEFLIQERRSKHIKLRYNTNLQNLNFSKKNLIEYWNHFRTIQLSISVDDLAERCEFIRDGSNWEKLIENIEYIKTKAPNVRLTLNPVITIFNIANMPAVLSYFVNEKKFFDDDAIWLMPVLGFPQIDTTVLPIAIKKEIINRYESSGLMQQFPQLRELIRHMMSADKSAILTDTRTYIKNIEDTRKKNFKITFPELASIMQE
jgi:MoaA/NifB/PqqE/SkfB family radical SAM enzyme